MHPDIPSENKRRPPASNSLMVAKERGAGGRKKKKEKKKNESSPVCYRPAVCSREHVASKGISFHFASFFLLLGGMGILETKKRRGWVFIAIKIIEWA